MRTLFPRRLVPALVVAVLMAGGCGRGAAAPVPPQPQPVDGGKLVFALPGDPGSVTPLYGGDDTGMLIERNVFSGLVDADPTTLRTMPAIARSWSASPDHRTYTFRLRPHVSFQDGGGPVTAATFVSDWALLCSPQVESPNAQVLAAVAGYGACASGSGRLAGVRADGPLTLVVRLSRPVADFAAVLVDPATWAFPPQLSATPAARAAFEANPVGAGPFTVDTFRRSVHPAGKRAVAGLVVLTRNPSYWGQRAHLARVVMPVVSGADARLIAAYRSGRYQVLPLPADEVDVVRADPEFDRQLLTAPRLSLTYLGRNRPGAPPLAGAVDASRVTTLTQGKAGQVADALVPVGMPGYVPRLVGFPRRSPARSFVTLTRQTDPSKAAVTAAVARLLRNQGAQVRLVPRGSWAVGRLDLQSAAPGAVIAGLVGPRSPLTRQVEAAGRDGVDQELLDAQRRLLDSGSVVPLSFGQTQLLVNPAVHGLGVDGLGVPRLTNVWVQPSS